LIPFEQLVPELLLAVGGALLLGNLAAYLRLRSRWRERGRTPVVGRGPAPAAGARPPAAAPLPSRGRVLANIAIGLAVSVAALAALGRTF
jgi:hypothetical protein